MNKSILILFFLFCLNLHFSFSQEIITMTMTKQELLDKGEITIYFENFNFETNIQIITYTVSAFIREGDFSIEVKGTAKFTGEVRELIKKMIRKQCIYFENIKVKLEDGSIRKLQTIRVKIK